MGATAVGVAQKEDEQQRIDQQDIVDRVVFLLAALTVGLFRRVLGADDAPLRPVMGTRATVAASAAVPPRRCAWAASEGVGASLRMRRAVSSTGQSTWIH
jgi:hypothetical protein